ncbi:MAG TPA: ABC transporter ATP-binding protein [Burkholderiaceae bacterium]|jgi:putative spermidine/putrescine transport system ATP-binding protein
MADPSADTAPTRVAVVDCAKTYGRRDTALHPTTLRVEPGEVLALLGPSGCGKTTLLRVIAGLVAPDAGGRVHFNDDDVTLQPIERRGVGMVFQHYALFPQMSVEANIGYGLRIRKVAAADIRRRVGELVDLVRLAGFEKRRPSELSGGQRQRVALARAVAVRPRVLLLDEPLTALDAKLKESLRDELAALLRRLRITAIHVTHDQHEAMAIADRLAVMSAGRIVQVGDAETLYRRPSDPFVAEFLGRVNRLERSAEDRHFGVVRLAGTALPCPGHLADSEHLFVRPEDIVVAPFDDRGDAQRDDRAAEVIRRVFLGDRVQLLVRGADARLVFCESDKASPIAAGARVRLSCEPHHFISAGNGERTP